MIKFLLSVRWDNPKECQEAMNLLPEWETIELEQALALLGGFFSLNPEYSSMCVVNPPKEEHIKKFKKIRSMAIRCLKTISVEKLDLIYLQLI